MIKKSSGESSGKCPVWLDRPLYEKIFKFNTILRDMDVYVPESVIFTGREPTSCLRDVVSLWQAAQSHSVFG